MKKTKNTKTIEFAGNIYTINRINDVSSVIDETIDRYKNIPKNNIAAQSNAIKSIKIYINDILGSKALNEPITLTEAVEYLEELQNAIKEATEFENNTGN